jgi:hypothetical protein
MYSRRHFTVSSALTIGCLGLACKPSIAVADDSKDDQTEITKWMDSWISSTKDLVGPLRVGRFADPMYFLLQPITWKPSSEQAGKYKSVTVPTGFVTDFASIPQLFWSLLKPDGLYAYAAVMHDYLYWTQEQPKENADDILKFGMQELGVSDAVVFAIYQAVRNFGQSSWDTGATLKATGERRILQKFPENDPRIRWEEWKHRPNVFRP